VALPVFKTGLAANIVAGGFDPLPPPPGVSELSEVRFSPAHHCSLRHEPWERAGPLSRAPFACRRLDSGRWRRIW